MKLFRHGLPGEERPGLVDADGRYCDLSAVWPDLTPATLGAAAMQKLKQIDPAGLPTIADGTRLGPCVGQVGNVVCIGLNYADHAAEAGLAAPRQPIVFSKHSGAVSGPNDPIWRPPDAAKLDWEVELAVVIGEPMWHVPEARALTHVAGYALANDVSERTFQLEMEGQWIKGKSYPSHCPLGPWLVTPDELTDPQQVDLWLDVNGVRQQTGHTRTMIFGVASILSYLSRFMRLRPGDVVLTGTPPGVGMGHKPPVYLRSGDVVTLGSSWLGSQRQTVLDYRP